MQTELFDPFGTILPDAHCPRCLNTGVWLTPTNSIAGCPKLLIGDAHPACNPAGYIMKRSAQRLRRLQIHINPFAFDLARILTQFSTDRPCLRLDLLEFFFCDTNLSGAHRLRKFHELVEQLRKIWLLPIGSRKSSPSGYWIITDLEDFKSWFARVKAAPITQLSTIHRVAKHNFPFFAEQIEFDFWNDLQTESEVGD